MAAGVAMTDERTRRVTRERYDYPAMMAELQAHPNEWRIVWRRATTEASQSKAAAVAGALDGWIKHPHRGPHGQGLCRKLGCDHRGEGSAHSRTDKVTDEVQVYGRWLDVPVDELSTWALEQIAEDERELDQLDQRDACGDWNIDRLKADCQAKRRMVEEYARWHRRLTEEPDYPALPDCFEVASVMVRAAISPYAERDGFKPQWVTD